MADIKITSEMLQALVAAEVAKLMTSQTPDERITAALDRARGKDRPLPPEEKIACVSPLTGATFVAHLIASRSFPDGRTIELLDYVRPDGWDVPRIEGGLAPDGMERKNDRGEPSHEFTNWVRKTFWQRDLEALVGKPLPERWRADFARADIPAGSVVLTPEQLERLGISPDELKAATQGQLESKAAE